jgi:signal transduction histidine kinase/ActR/RegA family two-component response regulator
MLFRKPLSVQQKMTSIIFLVSMLVLILTSTQFIFVELQRMRALAREDISSLANLISANVRFPLLLRDYSRSESVLDSLAARKEIVSSYLLLPNGKSFASYSRSQSGHVRVDSAKRLTSLKVEARQIAEGLQLGTEQLWQEGDHIAYFTPITFDGSHAGYQYLSMEPSGLRKQQLYLVLGWFLSMGVATLVTYWLSARLQRHISRPIEQLVERMGQVSREKRLLGFVPKQDADEFTLLFHGFDEMMSALKERDQMLERHRRNLEREVLVRTRALESEKEKAEQATIAKSRFLANMSHEIRTPMIGVLGMADLLRQKELGGQDRQLVETIYRSGEALLTILNDVLDFSKIEAGRLELETVPLDLVGLIEDVTNLMVVNAHAKGVAIAFSAPTDFPVVLGDPGRIRQILLNLVGNAVKFTEIGKVTVSLSIASSVNEASSDCLIVVQDTGVGIPKEVHSRIFDSFDQGHYDTTRGQSGTGLGLSIAKELVQMMNGRIALKSSPGTGSTFSVYLPMVVCSHTELRQLRAARSARTKSVVKGQPAVRIPIVSGCTPRVLLAEDNPTTQNLISIILQQMGVELAIVDNGQAALDFLARETVDLILMDCQMPQMDGYEATAQLRAQGVSIPIVALTAYARAEDEQQCLAAGMSDFLSKPFRQIELKDVLVRWLGVEVLSRMSAADPAH